LDAPVHNPQDESIGDLFGRLMDDGRTLARAEVNLYKQVALRRVAKARTGIILLAAGAVLGLSALTALIIGCVLALATLIGPLAAGFAVAAVLAIVAYFLVQSGVGGLQALSGDEEEREALRKGETL
jgi:hypothetical protein